MKTDLISNALETLCGLANGFMENIDARGDEWISLTSMVDHDGATNPAARNKIVMCVYNITRETPMSTYPTSVTSIPPNGGGVSFPVVNPAIHINIHLMFMANFSEKQYGDGLTALSRLISFFQQTPYFTRARAPGLSPQIDKLTMDFESLSAVDVNYVMGMLGTRYFPSAFYKLRMLPFVSNAMQSRAYPVGAAAASLAPS